MLIPHTTNAIARSAPLPRAPAVRYARRVQAARRWGRVAMASATLPTLSLAPGALVAPHALRLSRDAAANLAGLLRSVYERGWVSATAVSGLIGGDPAAIHAAVLDAINAKVREAITPIQALLGSTPANPQFAVHCPSITHAIADSSQEPQLFLDVLRSPVAAFPELPEVDTRALMLAWDALALESPFMVGIEHTADAYGCWEAEQLRDAACDGEWQGDAFHIDPATLTDTAEERGQTPEQLADAAERFVVGERSLAAMLKAPPPTDAELRPDVLAVVHALRGLTPLVAALPAIPRIDEGPYAPLALAPPHGIHAEVIDEGLESFGQEVDVLQFALENGDQLLDQFVHVSLHVAAAHAAFAKVLSLHDAPARPD